uniref:Uncharacterized protein n=1 Tax=Utricularia reniformis TaxID=192314 RepID=A0A1Y0B1R6_9LAMI|nr:hypothetical protein AEK19_MT1104 [Utricularia reniformis]ART31324.1 hypothetical protein AEK19_MT1104 [Utricularia reniformis]
MDSILQDDENERNIGCSKTIPAIRYSLHSSSMLFTESSSFGVLVDGCFRIPSLLQNWMF